VIFKSDIPPMIRLSEKTPLIWSTIIFDVALLIIFPTFLWLSWPTIAPVSVFIFLILCHTAIAVCRYGYGREILWPVWADILAVLSGIILIISAFIASTIYMSIILSVSGLVLCYGHCRKIFWPNLPYYFPEEKTAAQLVF
jgi:hypothetical protein|tara:strand:+ start:367 stop:789 length:423 start_codon:yes stop_codon:yes gene_type:complete